MATVIDALVVTLGLDAKGYKQGQKDAVQSLRSTSSEADRAAKNMEARGQQAAAFFSKLRTEALAFLAVFTAGVGIKRFTQDTINTAASLGLMSKNLSMSTQDLSSWQRAAVRAGGSAEGITAQLKESASEVAKLKLGMPGEGVSWFFRMGGKMEDLRDGNTYLLARSRIVSEIYKTDKARAAVIAQQMGISEDQFNLIRQGPGAIQRLLDAQRKRQVVTEKEASLALELRNKYYDLSDSFTSVGTRVLIALMPALERAIQYFQKLADWTAEHKDDIAKWVDEAVEAVKEFAQWADKAAESVGGWKNVLIALAALKVLSMVQPLFSLAGALMAVGKALGVIATGGAAVGVIAGAAAVAGGVALMAYSGELNSGEQGTLDAMRNAPTGAVRDKALYAASKFEAMGWSKEQALGLASNLMAESSMSHTAVGDGGKAYGLAQWHPDRQKKFKDIFGIDIRKATFDQQLEFINWELNNTERRAGNALRGATNNQVASRLVTELYERPDQKNRARDIATRQGYAASLFGAYEKYGMLPLNTVNMTQLPDRGPIAGSSSQTTVSIDRIDIHTQATDARGIAQDLRREISIASQANTGLR